MVKSLIAAVLIACLSAVQGCTAPRASTGAVTASPSARASLAVRAARILDPRTGTYTGPAIILVTGTRITDVIPGTTVDSAVANQVLDLGNATVLPGLIDAHVHLAIGGTVRANAIADLRAGFTTVADLGSLTTRMLRLRDSINAGHIEGPRVLAAGIWIGVKGGVCEFSGIGISGGAEAYRARVRENVQAGADLIKACVSSWPQTSHDHPANYEMPDSVLQAIVDEAHSLGRKVVAHDISLGGVQAALRAGVDGLAHSAYLDDDAARGLQRRGVFLISTLASLTAGDTTDVARGLFAGTAAAARAGVLIAFGTDAGVLPHGQNATEFLALTRAGLQPIEAIRAATINAARALGIADSVGIIAKGRSADFIAVEGDPLRDLGALASMKAVVSRGRIVPLH